MIQPLLLIPSFLQEGSCHEYFKCSPFRCSPLILLDNFLPSSSSCVFLSISLLPSSAPRCPLSGESYALPLKRLECLNKVEEE